MRQFSFVLALVCAAALTAAAPGFVWAEVYEQQMNVVYAETDGIGLVMDIFTPTGEKNGLAVVDVASGAWSSDRGKIEDHKRAQMFDILCGRGYTVFAVRPGSSSKFSAEEMVRHLKQAIRWVKARSEEFEIDPDRLIMCGASAGGHLTCLTITTPEEAQPDAKDPLLHHDTRVVAAVAFFPPTDFANYGRMRLDLKRRSPLSQAVGRLLFADGDLESRSEEEILAQIDKISPAKLVTSDMPPLLLIHGDADFIVPLQQSEVMKAACEAAGVPVELIVKKGGGHPWPTIHEEIEKAAQWMDQQLGIVAAAQE